MNPEKQRIAIAEACGTLKWSHALPTKTVACTVPDYLNDLNAMHEAVLSLPEEQQDQFRVELQHIVAPTTKPGRVGGIVLMSKEQYRNWFNATAAQRAEAFLKTIGEWEEA